MPYWKKLYDKEYLGHWDLEDVIKKNYLIEKIEFSLVFDQQKQEKVKMPCLKLKDELKLMVLNPGNGQVLADLYGEDSDKWVNKEICLFSGIKNGKMGIRIKAIAPKPFDLKPVIKALSGIKTKAALDILYNKIAFNDKPKVKHLFTQHQKTLKS